MPENDSLAIARILKVNHAGEYGAIRIYRAQFWFARRFFPDVADFLRETLAHEIDHCAKFLNAMPERSARPCRIMALWGSGGFLLGILTSLMGRRGIWVCTAAVEASVHRHLDDQLYFLRDRDPELHSVIEGIQVEENQHLDHAKARIGRAGLFTSALDAMITAATDTVIWLSTQGGSSKMARNLAASR